MRISKVLGNCVSQMCATNLGHNHIELDNVHKFVFGLSQERNNVHDFNDLFMIFMIFNDFHDRKLFELPAYISLSDA